VNRTHSRRAAAAASVAFALSLATTACGASNEDSSSSTPSDGGASLSGTLNGAGASSQESAMDAWKSGFQTANSGVTVNYDPSGSGAGVDQFLAGGVDFAGSDAYLDSGQMSQATKQCNGGYVEVPVYISRIEVVYNLSGVDTLNLSPDTVAGIFAGQITKWNDSKIAADNPGTDLPDTAITAVHRSDDSGTTFNFTDYLHQAASSVWSDAASETWPFKSGEGGDGTSGVIEAVTQGDGAIGYADASQAGDLGVANIKVGNKWVTPSPEAAAAVVEASQPAQGRPANDLAIDINRTSTDPGTYPVVLVSYQIACGTYADQAKADLVKAFLAYEVSSDGQQAAADAAGSAPLSDALSQKAATAINTITSAG
jgi:phosphate transport system substrate-binding protein